MQSGGFSEFFTSAWANPQALSASLWLIIAFPALGALVCGVFGRALGRTYVNLVGCASVLASLALSVFAFQAVCDPQVMVAPAANGTAMRFALSGDYGVWFSAGSFSTHFGLWVDHLSATMLLVVTGVGFLIHLYSTSYMEHDEGYWRFFAYLNLFIAAMSTLVLADNLVLLFVGWEGVGLCSYLLIGFWYTDAANAWAGRKAFIANRVGDCAFILAMMLLVLTVTAYAKAPGNETPAIFFSQRRAVWTHAATSDPGPLNFQVLEEFARYVPANVATGSKGILGNAIPSGPLAGYTYGHTFTVIFLLFLLGCAGKSAQLPLYVWLPDAMAGPTPVSALIHAATMVTAGVYLLCRMAPLLVFSPAAMAVVAMVGALTALYAALIAFAQDDLKKVLAYSTISQLGYMFLGVGVGVFWAAILHLVTHACFKGCLFLSAGSVMHGNDGELDVKKLGGLRKEMPWTAACFGIATLAITGIVPLSGFFSKDDILHAAEHARLTGYGWVGPTAYALGSLGALCTAFYMTRVYLLAFTGKRAPDARVPHAHESGWVMVAPLVVLAALSIFLVSHGLPWGAQWFAHGPPGQTLMQVFLRPVFALSDSLASEVHTFLPEPESSPLPGFAFALLLAWAGGGAAYYLYKRFFPAHLGQPAPAVFAAVRSFTVHKFYVDELYDGLFIRPVKYLSIGLFRVVDEGLIDTVLVGGTAWVTSKVGSLLRYIQTGDVQTYAAFMAVGLLAGVGYALFEVLLK
ncbi:MAG: proton-conducting transporter membrane subunit [Myxococcaceae bacterium]